MIELNWISGIAVGGYAGGLFGAMVFLEKGLYISALYGTFGAVGALLAVMTITAFLMIRQTPRQTNDGGSA